MNDYYKKSGLIDMEKRIDMLELLCKNDSKIEVSDIEREMNYQSTAIDAFRLILDKFSGNEIVFFMGEDNFSRMSTWKDYEELMKFNYIVFQRNENKILDINFKNVFYMKNNENLIIISTVISNKLQKNECIDDLVARDVKDYILRNKLYF